MIDTANSTTTMMVQRTRITEAFDNTELNFYKTNKSLKFKSKKSKVKKYCLFFIIFIAGLFAPQISWAQDHIYLEQDHVEVVWPSIIVQDINETITLKIKDSKLAHKLDGKSIEVFVNKKPQVAEFDDGQAKIKYDFPQKEEVTIQADGFSAKKDVTPIPLWMSILPPLIAIIMALVFKEVYSALFTGLLVGTTTIFFFGGSSLVVAFFQGIFDIVDHYIIESLSDNDHLAIIVFSMLIGATVHLITKNGGMRGVVNILSKKANSPRSGQFITWLLGILVFFDDYANTLVVGNTMRPVTDRLKISREKLSYLVDSTAAPVAAVCFVTTWIGAELSYIASGLSSLGLDLKPYNVLISSLNYAFYPIFTLVFMLMLILLRRDFGPMYKAEHRARTTGQVNIRDNGENNNEEELKEKEGVKARWYNAAIPIFVIIIGTFIGLFYTGWDKEIWGNPSLSFAYKLSETIGNADSFTALLWSSFCGMAVAMILTLSQKIMQLQETIDNLIEGVKSMLTAIMILTLAWSVAMVTKNMHTADFISRSLLEINLSPFAVPVFTFILSAIVSFATGSSWGTMAILYPLVLPAGWYIAMENGFDHDTALPLFFNIVSTVLAGSVLGDHCSPISDTTILSSLASDCVHIEHVRTQLPYALIVGGVSILFGTLPAAYGISSAILFPLGFIILFLIIKVFGKQIRQKV
ncbi:MAG: Na+/H+ antiporter NhaC family protein [Bacteroidales bacterium]